MTVVVYWKIHNSQFKIGATPARHHLRHGHRLHEGVGLVSAFLELRLGHRVVDDAGAAVGGSDSTVAASGALQLSAGAP